MKNPASRFIERAAENLGDDLTAIHSVGAVVAGRIVEDTGRLTKMARYQLRNGASLAVQVEEDMVAQFRARPLAYLLAAAGMTLVVGLKIFLDRQRKAGSGD